MIPPEVRAGGTNFKLVGTQQDLSGQKDLPDLLELMVLRDHRANRGFRANKDHKDLRD